MTGVIKFITLLQQLWTSKADCYYTVELSVSVAWPHRLQDLRVERRCNEQADMSFMRIFYGNYHFVGSQICRCCGFRPLYCLAFWHQWEHLTQRYFCGMAAAELHQGFCWGSAAVGSLAECMIESSSQYSVSPCGCVCIMAPCRVLSLDRTDR